MSDIFSINGSKIASLAYVNEVLKTIEDYLRSVDENFDGFKSIPVENKELEIESGAQFPIAAQDISEDHNHNFISETLLSTFANKPSSFEVDKALEDIKSQYKKDLEDHYMKIINTPNAIDKLRDIANILNDDEIVNNLVDTLASKATKEQLKEHEKSVVHMNNNDRKALNMLIGVLKAGALADWNADEKSPNYIANKPESLPANGGNADSIGGHGVEDVVNKSLANLVIGHPKSKRYDKDSCDIITDKISNETIEEVYKNGGNILLKDGKYEFDIKDYYLPEYTTSYIGNCRTTVELQSDTVPMNNATLKELTITGKIAIGNNCIFENVIFKNCNIVLKDSVATDIRFCTFEKCNIEIDGKLLHNLFIYNRFVDTDSIRYVGGNNTIINI